MTKEFYDYLFDLRSGGFMHSSEENTRRLFYFAGLPQDAPGKNHPPFSLSGHPGGEITSGQLDGEVGYLSEQQIRGFRNIIISVATALVLSARLYHADEETSQTLCDYYINQAESIRSPEQFSALSDAMFRDFSEIYDRSAHPSFGQPLDTSIAYIRQHLYSRLSAAEVAGHAGYNAAYLSSLFKERTGMTLYAYIQQEKLAEGTRLLVHTTQPVSLIASALGYHSVSHFSKAFKAALGVSPRKFRQMDHSVGGK